MKQNLNRNEILNKWLQVPDTKKEINQSSVGIRKWERPFFMARKGF